jgi:hypothetical protein
VFTLSAEPGPRDCAATLLRATVSDVVFSCSDEGRVGPIHKFVYDIRAKRLVSHFTYARYSMTRGEVIGPPGRRRAQLHGQSETERVVLEFTPTSTPRFRVTARGATGDGPSVAPSDRESKPFGPDGAFRLVRGDDATADGGRLIVESRRLGRPQNCRLPISTRRDYVKARLMRTPQNDAGRTDWIDESIGPWQILDDNLWFGRAFYEGEGRSGVGGIGFFSPRDTKFTLFSAEAIADWSAAALLVEPDAAWVALECAGEYGSTSGGIVRFDRRTQSFERLTDRGGIGSQFLRVGESLLLLTNTGVSLVGDRGVEHYIVDRTTDGRLRVVPSLR